MPSRNRNRNRRQTARNQSNADTRAHELAMARFEAEVIREAEFEAERDAEAESERLDALRLLTDDEVALAGECSLTLIHALPVGETGDIPVVMGEILEEPEPEIYYGPEIPQFTLMFLNRNENKNPFHSTNQALRVQYTSKKEERFVSNFVCILIENVKDSNLTRLLWMSLCPEVSNNENLFGTAIGGEMGNLCKRELLGEKQWKIQWATHDIKFFVSQFLAGDMEFNFIGIEGISDYNLPCIQKWDEDEDEDGGDAEPYMINMRKITDTYMMYMVKFTIVSCKFFKGDFRKYQIYLKVWTEKYRYIADEISDRFSNFTECKIYYSSSKKKKVIFENIKHLLLLKYGEMEEFMSTMLTGDIDLGVDVD